MTTRVELIYLEYEYRLHRGNVRLTSLEAISRSSNMWNTQYNQLPKLKPLENPLNMGLAFYHVKNDHKEYSMSLKGISNVIFGYKHSSHRLRSILVAYLPFSKYLSYGLQY